MWIIGFCALGGYGAGTHINDIEGVQPSVAPSSAKSAIKKHKTRDKSRALCRHRHVPALSAETLTCPYPSKSIIFVKLFIHKTAVVAPIRFKRLAAGVLVLKSIVCDF